MKKLLSLFLSVLCATFANAQYVAPSEGVFRIVNAEYNAALTEYHASNTLYGSEIGENLDFKQLWILKKSENYYTLQNAYTQKYIQTGNNVKEQPYWTGDEPKNFKIVLNPSKGDDTYNIWDSTIGNEGLHSKGMGERVVKWKTESEKAATEWRFLPVEVSEEELKKAQQEYAEYVAKEEAFREKHSYFSANIETFEQTLEKYFDDAACTSLKIAYASMDENALRSAMTADALPETLIDMAVKIKSGDWSEPNDNPEKLGWESNYAKKFRVQMIEPHSIAGEITTWFGINAHSNMDNPTGLYANIHEFLFVFVEGEIKEGSELWVTWLNGHSKMPNYDNGYSNGIQLKSGLNIIPIYSDGSAIFFNYLVHTYDRMFHKFPNKLSDFDDLKIHVEGGHINGYYNAHGDMLYTADTDADWEYYEERANLRNITVLGKYQVLQFELNDVTYDEFDKEGNWKATHTDRGMAKLFPDQLPDTLPQNQRINAIVEAWDRIMLSQLITFGVANQELLDSINEVYPRWDGKWKNKGDIYNYEGYADFCEGRDYSDYFNHRGLAYGVTVNYMFASWDYCGYHVNTTESILTKIATESGSAWGPGHEIGHQHQGIFTLNGQMEVTNNLFANISAWYMGMGTSRVNGTDGNLAHVYDAFRNNGDLYDNNIWAITQMYYRLWLYYHRAGNNTQFYPRLFELLRQTPMNRQYYQQGKDGLLRFYRHCCDAAEEDLTEFFRAYGFFRVMDHRFVGDYSNSEYIQSQEDIDEAIAAVKAKNYPINNLPLFINDCVNEVTYSHDGKTERNYWDKETGDKKNADVGMYTDFLNKTPVTGKYVYSLVKMALTKITIEAEEGADGAVGFALYDNESGEILAFSNNYSFYLTKEAESKLRSEKATLVAVAADGNDVEVMNKALQGTPEEQLELLKKAHELAKKYLAKSDTTGTKVGYLIPDSVVEFVEMVAKIDTIIATNDDTQGSFGGWYAALDAMTAATLANSSAHVPMTPNNFYSIALSGTDRYLCNIVSGLAAELKKDEKVPNNMQWRFIEAQKEGTFYIQHRETGNYISEIASNSRVRAKSKNSADAIAFTLVVDVPGELYIQRADNDAVRIYNNSNNQASAGNQNGDNAKWRIWLEDDMLALPETSTDELLAVYYIQRTDNNEYAYKISGRDGGGRLGSGMFNDHNDYGYWFYFQQGSQEGKYTIYNYNLDDKKRYPVTSDAEGNLYANVHAETVPEFTIDFNEDSTAITIVGDEGYWDIVQSSATRRDFVVQQPENNTTWKVQYIRTISLTDEPLESITLSKKEAEILEGESITLTVTETAPDFAIDHSVVWSSSDTEIATVDAEGNVTAIKEGTAIIKATANDGGGAEATCQVTVQSKLLKTLSMSKKSSTIYEGDSITLTVKTAPSYAVDHSVTWSSNNTEVATVDANGKVKAITEGTAVITATANDGSGLSATCKVTVKKKNTGIYTTEKTNLSVKSQGGIITIDGVVEGTVVSVYNTVGSLVATAIATENTVTLNTGITDRVVIVKVGEHNMKVAL